MADNVLDSQVTAPTPHTAWVADIAYLWTHDAWLYLVVILDLFARRVVGWALHDRITRQLAVDALTMALPLRRPRAGLMPHADRGSQSASADSHAVLAAPGIVCRMRRRGHCWYNALAESFFSALKMELGQETEWATPAAVPEYLEIFYHTPRRHGALGYLRPVAFARRDEAKKMA